MANATIPGFSDWLLAQGNRKDLVGTLARLSLSESNNVRKLGFEAWLEILVDGRIMQSSVVEAQAEYARCVEELTTMGHSKSFPLSVRALIQGDVGTAREKHKAEPEVSKEAYLHALHKRLRKEVEAVTRLYLDTNHWIGLLNVILGRPPSPRAKVYADILARARDIKAQGKLICPISFPLFLELLKQTDPKTRRPMAALMDELSAGVCVQPPDQIERIELKQQLLKTVMGSAAPDLGEWVWTKAGAVCGEWSVKFRSDALPKADVTLVQKVLIDDMWNMSLAALAEFHPGVTSDHVRKLTARYNASASNYRARGATFDEVLMDEKVLQVRKLLETEEASLLSEISREFPAECAAFKKGAAGNPPFDPRALASVQIRAAIHASFITQTPTMKVEENDLIDALHAATALPHFTAMCVDKGLAHRLMNPPLNFAKLYGSQVFWAPEKLLDWLNTL